MPPTPVTIPITPGSGQNLDAVQLTVSAETVAREIVTLGDPLTGDNLANVTAAGGLQVDGSGVTQPVAEVGAANAASGQISVLVSATEIVIGRATRNAVKITNTTGVYPVWIGFTSGVSAVTGDLLPAIAGAFVIIPAQSAIYGIAVGGTQIVSFLDLYN